MVSSRGCSSRSTDRSVGRNPLSTILPDLLGPNLRIVFCGSAVGPQSARRKAYYAGPGNRFWDVLHAVGLTPRRLEPSEYLELLSYGIGLTDMVKTRAALDADLSPGDNDPAALRRKLEQFTPRTLAFNGKHAARVFLARNVEYGKQPERVGETTVFVLPSTSGAARRYWNVAYWQELTRFA